MASETSPATKRARPLSPHLQIYKPQITSVMSITHRATGIALAAGTLLLTAWIVSVALGPEAHAGVAAFAGSWFGRLLLLGWSAALFYHLLNGIRHLVWDAGYGFDLARMQSSGYGVLIGTAVLTALAAVLGFAGGLR
jgi:succinate dehydrogenase / fumarate reductase cytochrome b subunit